MNSSYKESINKQQLQLPIDIFGFKMAKLSALNICLKVKILNFPHNLKISAIIKDTHLKFAVPVSFCL